MFEFATFDIEAKNWNEHLLSGLYTGDEYYDFNDLSEFFDLLSQAPHIPNTIYAHFGGIYDFLFLFDFIFNLETRPRVYSIVMQSAKILSFRIALSKTRKYTFIDSSGIIPFGLAKACESFGVENKKQPFDVENITHVTDELREYLFYDCVSLYEVIDKYYQENGFERPVLTRTGASFANYKKYYNMTNDELPKLPKKLVAPARSSYFGGRTEIFKMIGENLNYYDINSLYPFVMQRYFYPTDYKHVVHDYDGELGLYNITIKSPPNIHIPVLPVKLDKLYFPIGEITGWYTTPEIDLALEMGYELKRVNAGHVFKSDPYLFRSFIKHQYKKRVETSCPVKKILCKDNMNHLYGRMGINIERPVIHLDDRVGSKLLKEFKMAGGDRVLFFESKKELHHIYSNPLISSYVTAYARCYLYRSMRDKFGFDVYYCDTDSVFTRRTIKTSEKLGGWKLEYKVKRACFTNPKSYILDLGEKYAMKVKGIPNKILNNADLSFDDFKNFVKTGDFPAVEIPGRGLERFKTGLSKSDFLTIRKNTVKKLHSCYDKRIMLDNYQTMPINIGGLNNPNG